MEQLEPKRLWESSREGVSKGGANNSMQLAMVSVETRLADLWHFFHRGHASGATSSANMLQAVKRAMGIPMLIVG